MFSDYLKSNHCFLSVLFEITSRKLYVNISFPDVFCLNNTYSSFCKQPQFFPFLTVINIHSSFAFLRSENLHRRVANIQVMYVVFKQSTGVQSGNKNMHKQIMTHLYFVCYFAYVDFLNDIILKQKKNNISKLLVLSIKTMLLLVIFRPYYLPSQSLYVNAGLLWQDFARRVIHFPIILLCYVVWQLKQTVWRKLLQFH